MQIRPIRQFKRSINFVPAATAMKNMREVIGTK